MPRCWWLTLSLIAGYLLWRALSPTEDAFRDIVPPKKFQTRIIAVGDLHGDLPHAQRVLRLAGLVDHRSRWIGKRAVLVQTGDIVDRGRDTIALYAFFDQLRAQAEKAGGVVVSLLGNHEMMNAFGDWRYVTDDDIASFGGERNRRRAMSGDGWIGKTWLANYTVTARVPYAAEFEISPVPFVPATDTKPLPSPTMQIPFGVSAPFNDEQAEDSDVFALAAASFVHGGIHPDWAARDDPIESINAIGRSLLAKAIDTPFRAIGLPSNLTAEERDLYSVDGPFWYRGYALEEDEAKICEQVERVRQRLGVRRLVMGHTPNFEGIVSRCKGKLLLIDTGISRAYGGALSCLEILYTLAPVTSLLPTPVQAPKDATQKWREMEQVSALYENRDKVTLVRMERQLDLPLLYT